MSGNLRAPLLGCIIACLCNNTVAFTQELDNLIAEYSYTVEEHTRALIPEGLDPDDIPFVELERLTPTTTISTIREGIDNQNGYYLDIQIDSQTVVEDWMSPAYRMVSTPVYIAGYDREQNEMYRDSLAGNDLAASEEFRSDIEESGYAPALTLFPTLSSARETDWDDASFVEHSDGSFEIIQSEGSSVRFYPDKLIMTEQMVIEDERMEVTRSYTYLDPFGYVPVWEVEIVQEDTEDPVVAFMTSRKYSGHQILDPTNRILRTTDLTHIKVSPVPLGDYFTITLTGLHDELIYDVSITDHMGSPLYSSHLGGVESVELSSDDLPSGTLVIQAWTDRSVYSTLVTNQ